MDAPRRSSRGGSHRERRSRARALGNEARHRLRHVSLRAEGCVRGEAETRAESARGRSAGAVSVSRVSRVASRVRYPRTRRGATRRGFEPALLVVDTHAGPVDAENAKTATLRREEKAAPRVARWSRGSEREGEPSRLALGRADGSVSILAAREASVVAKSGAPGVGYRLDAARVVSLGDAERKKKETTRPSWTSTGPPRATGWSPRAKRGTCACGAGVSVHRATTKTTVPRPGAVPASSRAATTNASRPGRREPPEPARVMHRASAHRGSPRLSPRVSTP